MTAATIKKVRKYTDWRTWIRGLAAATVGGVANAVTMIIVDPEQFNLHAGWPSLWRAAVVSGILNAAFYLKEYKIPPRVEEEYEEEETPVQPLQPPRLGGPPQDHSAP